MYCVYMWSVYIYIYVCMLYSLHLDRLSVHALLDSRYVEVSCV